MRGERGGEGGGEGGEGRGEGRGGEEGERRGEGRGGRGEGRGGGREERGGEGRKRGRERRGRREGKVCMYFLLSLRPQTSLLVSGVSRALMQNRHRCSRRQLLGGGGLSSGG